MNKGKVLSRLTKYFPRKYLFVIGLIVTILSSIIQISFSYLFKVLLDTTLSKDLNQFYEMLIAFIAAVFLNVLFIYIATKSLGFYSEGGLYRLRNNLTQKIIKMKYHHFSETHSGDLTSTATNDMNNVRDFTYNTFPELIKQPILVVMALILLFIYSWKLTLIILISFPILFIGMSILNKPISKISGLRQKKLANVNTIATDYIKGVEVSKAYNIEEVLKEKYNNAVDESILYGKKVELRRSIINSFSMIFSLAPFFLTFIIGGIFVSNNEVSIGTLLGFIYLLNFITNPINDLIRLMSQYYVDKASITRIFEVLNKDEESSNGEDFKESMTAPLIEFRNVSFKYPNQENNVLNNISFKILTNESIALVGQSGCGKSTITKLLLGYYDNYEGEILIGGHELKEWNLKSLRELMAYVSQDTFLFPETIEENIMYGNLEATNDQIITAAKRANADAFIKEFKEGYQTKVSELGGSLSGGQKQRVAIARALINNGLILVFDEATSALDNESEALIQKALEDNFKNKTSIIIAHRLSTIRNVDKIYVFNEGEIVEEGTHQELLNNGNFYSNLYRKQFDQSSQKEGDLCEEE